MIQNAVEDRAARSGQECPLGGFMASRFILRIPNRLYEEMVAHAAAELPFECCGLLAGKVAGDIGVVTHRFPLANVAADPATEFLSEPRAMLAAVKAIRAAAIDVLAVYHSHPASDPVPSRKDRERSYGEVVQNLIIGFENGRPNVRTWWLSDSDYSEGRWEVDGGTA
jgi:[CysO sulfur-carrier protein]-S-L-cysteine hydrolase